LRANHSHTQHSDVGRAYRKASLRVHPDKDPSPQARVAFDALKEVHKKLLDAAQRREYVQEEGDKLAQKLAAEQPVRLTPSVCVYRLGKRHAL
jgi:DnaJ-class molecular chaperone